MDVIVAKAEGYRLRQVKGLVLGLMWGGFAVAPYPQGYPEFNYMDLWFVRIPLAIVALPCLFIGRGLFRPLTLPVLEVRRESVRFIDGDEVSTIARAAVVKARLGSNLGFVPATDERMPYIMVRHFDLAAVRAALELHGWT